MPGSLASSNGDWTGAVSLKRMWRSSTSALYLAGSSRDIRRTSSAHMTVPTAKVAGVEGGSHDTIAVESNAWQDPTVVRRIEHQVAHGSPAAKLYSATRFASRPVAEYSFAKVGQADSRATSSPSIGSTSLMMRSALSAARSGSSVTPSAMPSV